MTAKFWLEGLPIKLRCDDDGRPVSFIWGETTHKVRMICNRWQASEEWWRSEPEAWREYVKVLTHTGLVCLIAHDVERDDWSILSLYD